jgi:hypothetical protein
MANTRAQIEAEKWIREFGLKRLFHQAFRQRRLKLRTKGKFQFDAVSDDGKIVAVISTSAGPTSSGKLGAGKLKKIWSDLYWFLMLEHQPERCLLVFTEESMANLVDKEKQNGRVPSEFEILQVTLPSGIAARVSESRKRASEEVSPVNSTTRG